MEMEFQTRNFPFGMEMTQNVWKWNGNEVSKQTSKRWQILAKTPDFEAENPFIEVSTRKSAGDHFN